MAEELCPNCCAPRVAGYAECKYCKTPFVQNTQTGAIPCPQCQTLNEMGAQRCAKCQAWVVVQCVFCHALSPHNVPGCLKCGEAFAGAPQRLAERQRQQHLQQGLQVAGAVGNVAASFLGAAAGAGMFSHHEHQGGYGPPVAYGPPPPDYGPTGAGIAQANSGGGFFDSIFGGSSDDSGTGAGIAQSNDSGGGFLDSLLGGSSDDSGTGAGISSNDDSGGGSFGDDDS
jgi:hypothetical protein